MLKQGDKAPGFRLASDRGDEVALEKLRGRKVVVYFYPRDDTPGCTREAIGFTGLQSRFAAAGVTVLGISRDSVDSHCRFRDKYKLSIPLLSDPTLAVHRAYGAWGEKTMYGKKVEGVIRSTFLIDEEGRIARAWPSVKVDGHPEAVLAAATGEAPPNGKRAGTKKPAAKPKAPAKPQKKKPAAKARPASRR